VAAIRKKRLTPEEIFFNGKLDLLGLCWDNCVGVCTDGAGAMLEKNKELAALVCEVTHVRFTHCMIHREVLPAKPLPDEFNAVLKTDCQFHQKQDCLAYYAKKWGQNMNCYFCTWRYSGCPEVKYCRGYLHCVTN